MMASVDQNQNHKITIIFSLVAALGGIVALLTYWDKKKTSHLETDVLALNKQIKELELYRLQNSVIAGN
jgi:hypothetical protein